ncbi:MAG: signal peptidase I [Alphaproteobacteria bacterium]|nr:signal peptidase I [Alphaproteobacteria bacterium]
MDNNTPESSCKKDNCRAYLWNYLLKGRADFIDESQKFLRFVVELAWAFVIAMIIRSFLLQPFIVPTGSMIPTILVGDFLFANKTAHGYTKYSFPLQMIPFEGRIMAEDPKVGDVIVFHNPLDDGKDYVKRCVARSGDRVQMKGGILHINGKPLPVKFVREFASSDHYGRVMMVKEYIETLPNGVEHPIYKIYPFDAPHYPSEKAKEYNNTQEFVVPEGHSFGMGDNRDNSVDSREPMQVGFVPDHNLIGKAVFRWMSIEDARWWAVWEWPWTIRYSRIGTFVK